MNFPRNIRLLYLFSALKMALFPMAIITLFWKDRIGLSLAEILLLQGCFSLATLLLEYPSGYLADRLGYRYTLSLAAAIGIAGWSLYTVAASFAAVLAAELLLGCSYAFISGSDSALLFETLRTQQREEEYARFDGRMTGWGQGGEALAALFAGLLYAWQPLSPFLLQIAVWGIAWLVTRSLREPPYQATAPGSSHLGAALRTCRYALLENRRLRATLLFSMVLGVASFYPVWLIQPFMQECNVPLAWFGPIWAAANLTVALFSFAGQRFHFQLGERGLFLLYLGLILAGYLGLGLTHALWSFACYFLLTAMRGLQGPLLRHHLQRDSTRENRASILSLKSLGFRLLFVVTGPPIGWLADRYGLSSTFLLVGLLLVLALIPLGATFLTTRPAAP
ncbi:MFS transporter [Desulfuromonas sp. DDH964]|uniref:MFS transporter n=1 Tax=Desulfuromonas sp. DDH964 TaxID=1823759 RepID=UPI00078C6090|nr:MFS transporter [Desulfuromonas sp. DDH964]AMV71787.1 MFS transporter [Desulfuromonas sp. DDH964]